MSQRSIYVGSALNDVTGDPFRDAFRFSNLMFDELYLSPVITNPIIIGNSYPVANLANFPAGSYLDGTVVASDFVQASTTPIVQTPRSVFSIDETTTVRMGYRVQVDTAGTFTSLTGDSRAVFPRIPFTAALAGGTTYYARVNGSDQTTRQFQFNTVTRTPVADTSIVVGSNPRGGCFSPTNARIYQCNLTGNSISVIDPSSNLVVATVTISVSGPNSAVYCPYNDRVYVAQSTGNNVAIVNPGTNLVTSTISTGAATGPSSPVYCPTNNKIYVSLSTTGFVAVIDPVSNTLVRTIQVGTTPRDMWYCQSNNRIYCTNSGSSNVSVIDPLGDYVVATITVGSGPRGICYCPTNDRIYCANNTAGTVSVIDPQTNLVVTTIASMSGAFACAFFPTTDRVYVCNNTAGQVASIDPTTNTSVATVAVATAAYAVFSPTNGRMYVSSSGGNSVSVLQ